MNEPEVFEHVASHLSDANYEFLIHIPSSHKSSYRAVVDKYPSHEITIDGGYPDILGFTPEIDVFAVEVKGSAAITKGIGQALSYQRGSDASYLAAPLHEIENRIPMLLQREIGVLGVTDTGVERVERPPGLDNSSQTSDIDGRLTAKFRLTGNPGKITTLALAQPLNFLAPPLAVNRIGSEASNDELVEMLETAYGQSGGTIDYSVKGASTLGLISGPTHTLTEYGRLAIAVLDGSGIETLSQLRSAKRETRGTVVIDTYPEIATFLRSRYLQHPDVRSLVEVLEQLDEEIELPDLLLELLQRKPNVFLNLFCKQSYREDAREHIQTGTGVEIAKNRELWESYLRSNVLQNFVQQLKHIGILAPETPSHHKKLSEYNPTSAAWKPREDILQPEVR